MVGCIVGMAAVASAQTNGTWTNTVSGGLWGGTINWSGGAIADGSGATAYFTNDVTADHVVRLDSARTVGNLIFGDGATNSPAGRTLDNNGDAANVLTLAGPAPTITVNALGTDGINKAATISAEIAGSSGFTKAGVGVLSLTASNSYSGSTTVSGGNGGILAISHAHALGATNAGTAVASGNQLRLLGGITVAGEGLTISGSGALPGSTERRGALRSHSGSNVWAGPIVIAGTSETWISDSGGGLALTGGVTGTNAVLRLDQGSPLVTGKPINLGTNGQLLVNASAGRLAVADNSFSTLRIDWNGNLRTEVPGALPTNATLVLGTLSNPFSASSHSGTLNLFGNSQTIARLMDGGTTYVNEVVHNSSAAAATLTINQSANSTYLGRITGNLGLTKGGSGTLALGGSNTYSGATLVSNGTLLVNGRHIGGGQYAVASGATLGGTGLISAALASASGGVVAPGNSIGTMTVFGDADLDGILKIELDSSGFGSSDLLVVTGSLDISSATLDLDLLAGPLDDDAYILAQYGVLAGTFASISDAPGGYQIDYAYNGNQIALVIPEPPGFSLILMCALAMAPLWGRKRWDGRGIPCKKGMPGQAR